MGCVRLQDRADIQFAKIAPMAKVDGARLPSGFEVPRAPGGEEWVVFGSSLVLVPLSSSFTDH